MTPYRITSLPGRCLLPFFGIVISIVGLACNGKNSAGPAETRFQLTVIAGAGGSIVAPVQASQAVEDGAATTISARADRGYAFARWVVLGDNASVSYVNSPDAEVTLGGGNDTVRAEFIAVPALPGHIDISAMPRENGVNFLRYSGSWTTLPDFAALAPDSAGPADSLAVTALPHGTGGFGAVLNGYLSIPIDGSYSFFLTSSDGSALYLNDSLMLSNDGVHAAPSADSVMVPLTQGDYLIGVRYFNATSSPFLNVSYACPDIGIDRMTIPKDALQRCDTRPVAKITINRPAGGETFRLGDTVHVQWTYKNSRGQTVAQISADNGKTFSNICDSAFAGTISSYDWLIPPGADYLITQTAVIRVKEYPPFDATGVSKVFSIAAR
ncbi:MAG: hypothetical protein JXA71_06860 [Chitinispirillaceae bacterium]|nr:hypothetical protein [Chitinispirillaceae bacterium]